MFFLSKGNLIDINILDIEYYIHVLVSVLAL